jgi:hypothetical protein
MKNEYEVSGEVVVIFLNRRDGTILETQIETTDLAKMLEYEGKWTPWWNKCTKSYYVQGHLRLGVNKKTKIYLHRYLTDAPKGQFVDHENNDTLDNRRSNLRFVTNAENQQNRKSTPSDNKSGVLGVSWNRNKNKWQCHIKANGKNMYLGLYDDLEVAKRVVEDARKRHMPYSKEALAN